MANNYFKFKEFLVIQEKSAMKVCTDACLFGAWTASSLPFKPDNILDIGTGTGLLSLMLAQKFDVNIDAVEIESLAADEAKSNFHQSPWNTRLHLHHNDISSFEPGIKYNLIISNPPFYESDLRTGNEAKDKARHDTGLTTSVLFQNINRLLEPATGIAVLLMPYSRGSDFLREAHQNNLSPLQILDIRPVTGKTFFRTAVMLSAKGSDQSDIRNEMEIKDEDGKYSEYFTSLLQEYYLNL